ncbi:MAG TPA: OmpH family outer membrane protein [Candidatus Binatia bacterium]|nr:OmpH family outer membrane protein [Candidatus Binatia bacterium]
MRLLSLSAILLVLAAAPARADVKIGAIRTPVLLRDAPQIKDADTKLKAEFDKKEKELDAEGRKLQDDFKKYQRDGDSMSAQQRATAEKDLSTRKIDFEQKQRQYSEEAQARNSQLRQEVLGKMSKAIEEVAKEKSLDVVLQDPAWMSPALDITDDVLKKLGVSASAAPKADAPKKK